MTILSFPGQMQRRPMRIRRLRLPVAPMASAGSRFAGSDKPVPAMLPQEAVSRVDALLREGREILEVEISGPGDPLAAPAPTLETLQLLHDNWPELRTSVTTLGLGAPSAAGDLAKLGVSRVTIMVDGVKSAIVEKIYAWIRPGRRTILPLARAVHMLIKGQEEAVRSLHAAGIAVHILTRLYPGINDHHAQAIARHMAALGAESMTILAREDGQEHPSGTEPIDPAQAREQAGQYLEILAPVPGYGTTGPGSDLDSAASALPRPSAARPNVAVVSASGMDVDLHLGQADRILIYGPRGDGLPCLLEARPTPAGKQGTSRWQLLASKCLHDCFVLLAANAGDNPRRILDKAGIRVLLTEDNIEGTVDVLFGGGKKKKKCRQESVLHTPSAATQEKNNGNTTTTDPGLSEFSRVR